jgi:hypothetical protein
LGHGILPLYSFTHLYAANKEDKRLLNCGQSGSVKALAGLFEGIWYTTSVAMVDTLKIKLIDEGERAT